MIQPNLFPPDPEPVVYPGEPALWIKRIVILPAKQAVSPPIRDISFRLGLNVINTSQPTDPDTVAFGHNVGKTLLMRLIRYCLGDEQYAGPRVRSRIRAQMGDGCVLALVRVQGEDWGVVRSLSSARQSFSLKTANWHDLLGDHTALSSFADYEQALNRLRPSGLDYVRVGRNNRVPAWTDLLGWLIRDQRCRFTNHNTWRDKDDDSEPDVLLDTDANLVARIVMNLFDREEYDATDELERERATLKQLQTQLAELRVEQDRTAQLLGEEAGILTDFGDGDIAHATIRSGIEERRKKYAAQIEELAESKALTDAEGRLLARRRERDKTEGAIEQRKRDLARLHQELELAQKPDEASALAARRQSLACGHKDCHYLLYNSTTPDPTRDDRIIERKDEIKRVEQELAAVTAELDQQNAAVRDAEGAVRTSKSVYDEAASEPRQNVLRCDFLLRRFEKFVASRTTRDDLDRRRQATETKIKELDQRRKTRADSRRQQLERLNEVFQEVMLGLLRRQTGKLSLDLVSGIAPNPEASSGEALGSAGRVVGFDLMCLAASLDGHGHHPRFLVHDSPREADLNELIYRNLFRYVLSLEGRFPGCAPAFQYILTTTSPPPDLVTVEHIRETLHDETPSGRLLGFEFE
jgi:hypothetical protein